MKKTEEFTSKELVDVIVDGIQEKKGKNIVILDMNGIDNSICNYFVICEGDSNTHVDAVADSVEEFVWKNLKEHPYHIEGKENAEWILIDYVDVIVHVFQKSVREFYNLEGLWADAKRTEVEDIF
ncbi:MAG: ribosome silencing factor [Chlorobi bacterium]|nr:ribosome silencing factor [Chlorobiota bacterium]